MLKGSAHTPFNRRKRSVARRFSQGMSIVELLVGVAIGLFILAGASALFVGNVTNSRRLLLESRINQDLRATMDLVTRDLRRGAYWGNALAGTLAVGSTSVTQPNPYAAVIASASSTSGQILYSYSRDPAEDNALDSTEVFGFRLTNGAVQMCFGGSSSTTCTNWQTLTNTDIVTISAFAITPTETSIDIRAACAKPCTDTLLAPSCPRVQVRSYNIVLTGTSTTDSAVTRTLRSQVRVRNDAMAGSCPA